MRTNATERAHLQKMASARSITVSDLIRQALHRYEIHPFWIAAPAISD